MDINIADFINTILTSDAFATLVLTAVASTVATAVGAIVYYVRKRILKDLDAAELAQLREIASLAVQFAEQKFAQTSGPIKLAEAMKAADAMLQSYGIKVTTTQLRTVIEAAVYTAIAQKQPAPENIVVSAPPAANVEVTGAPA